MASADMARSNRWAGPWPARGGGVTRAHGGLRRGAEGEARRERPDWRALPRYSKVESRWGLRGLELEREERKAERWVWMGRKGFGGWNFDSIGALGWGLGQGKGILGGERASLEEKAARGK